MTKVAIYIRVSTHHQIDKDSLPLQRQDLINYSNYMLNTNEYEIFEDAGYSGKNTVRPAYQSMMTRIRNKEFTHLLVWKIDRISRNLLDFCDMYNELKKYNCVFISKNEQFDTSSAMGEAMLKIILVFAELERKLTGERVTAVMLDRATKGLWNGAPIPLGYAWDKTIKFPVIDKAEAETVELIYNTYLKTRSTTAIKVLLNSTGIKTKKEGTWTTKTISDIIRNPFYKGTYRYNYREPARGKVKNKEEWILLEDNHQAIISKEIWEQCNLIMDENAKRNNAAGFRANGKIHVFAGLLQCGECHKSFYAKEDKPNLDGYIPSLYVCSGRYNHLGCNQKTISDNYVGTFVLSFISNILKLQRKISKLGIKELENALLKGKSFRDVIGIENIEILYQISYRENIFSTEKEDPAINQAEIDIIQKEKTKHQRALERLDDLYLFDDNAMSEKDYILKKSKITEKLNEIDEKLNNYATTTSATEISLISEITHSVLSKELVSSTEIDYKKLAVKIGKETLKEFVNDVINKVIIKDRQILSIIFRNGIEIKFVYNTK